MTPLRKYRKRPFPARTEGHEVQTGPFLGDVCRPGRVGDAGRVANKAHLEVQGISWVSAQFHISIRGLGRSAPRDCPPGTRCPHFPHPSRKHEGVQVALHGQVDPGPVYLPAHGRALHPEKLRAFEGNLGDEDQGRLPFP